MLLIKQFIKHDTFSCKQSKNTMHMHQKIFEYDGEALSKELQEYKQMLWHAKDENNMLKVAVRRLEESLRKKNRGVIDTHYLGSYNKLLLKEKMTQFTHKIEILKQENVDLKEAIFEKDHTIRQMQKKITSYSAYKPKTTKAQTKTRTQLNSAGASGSTRSTTITFGETSPLLKTDTERSVQQSDTQTSLIGYKVETPHEEIEKLHTGFKDIVDEVSKLKQSMSQFNDEHSKTISDMRMREKNLIKQLYLQDKEQKQDVIAYQTIVGNQKRSNVKKQPSVQPQQPQQQPRKAVSAFARVSPKPPTKGKGKKHNNPYAIRTCSKNSLLDETDMKLYIDEIIMDMNRENFK